MKRKSEKGKKEKEKKRKRKKRCKKEGRRETRKLLDKSSSLNNGLPGSPAHMKTAFVVFQAPLHLSGVVAPEIKSSRHSTIKRRIAAPEF